MLTDGQTLLKAIRADPDNDLPRLVYADYLEENGQPERAAFVRLQCEFSRKCQAGDGVDDAIRGELGDFWAEFQPKWMAELPQVKGVTWDLVFNRGFIERVVVDTDATLLAHAEEILGFTPIHHLCVQRFTGVPGALLLPTLRHLKSVSITMDMTDAAADELLAWTGFRADLLLILRSHLGPDTHRVPELNAYFRPQLLYPLTPPIPPPPAPRPRGRRRRNRNRGE